MTLRRLQYARAIFKGELVRRVIPVICRTNQRLSVCLPAYTFCGGNAPILLVGTRMFASTRLLQSARISPPWAIAAMVLIAAIAMSMNAPIMLTQEPVERKTAACLMLTVLGKFGGRLHT